MPGLACGYKGYEMAGCVIPLDSSSWLKQVESTSLGLRNTGAESLPLLISSVLFPLLAVSGIGRHDRLKTVLQLWPLPFVPCQWFWERHLNHMEISALWNQHRKLNLLLCYRRG